MFPFDIGRRLPSGFTKTYQSSTKENLSKERWDIACQYHTMLSNIVNSLTSMVKTDVPTEFKFLTYCSCKSSNPPAVLPPENRPIAFMTSS
ncbi:hypothetical protein GJ496_010281 [Pomphorhynchus laevis]|nr:hypothetical protein GJ496_010281 [Pomphorhynchus laevis]